MEGIFSHDVTLCKNILETLNLPNEQLMQLTIRPTTNFDHIITVLHKDIPWGPTHALPNMFSHPQITTIQRFPQESEPRYEHIGNPQAVYLMIRRRLFTQLQYILNRIVQQLDFLFVPAPEIRVQRNTTTPLLSGILSAPVQPRFAHTPNTLAIVVPPPADQFLDADSVTGISHSPESSEISPQSIPSTQPECLSPPREFTTTQTQADEQTTQVSYMIDSPWAWLDP
jgi:hypothetical protein